VLIEASRWRQSRWPSRSGTCGDELSIAFGAKVEEILEEVMEGRSKIDGDRWSCAPNPQSDNFLSVREGISLCSNRPLTLGWRQIEIQKNAQLNSFEPHIHDGGFKRLFDPAPFSSTGSTSCSTDPQGRRRATTS
jgi:hypothetical protein